MTNQTSSDALRPFLSAPDPRRYYAAAAIEEARTRVARCVMRDEGPALVIGAAGMGKSLLLAVLAQQFAGSRRVVELVGAQLCTRRALLQSLLAALDQPYRQLDEGELRLSLLEYLRAQRSSRRRPLILVDEADALPVRLLEELRALASVAADGRPLMSLVLAGGASLEERFAEPGLVAFSQRIAARCYLSPFSREETLQFVRAQVAAVGLKPQQLLEASALNAMHAATGGVPRLLNQLGDQLMWMVEETGCTPLDAALVQQAWSELQQLPAPWQLQTGPASDRGSEPAVIEFGELDAAEEALAFDAEPLHAGGSEQATFGDELEVHATPPSEDGADEEASAESYVDEAAVHEGCGSDGPLSETEGVLDHGGDLSGIAAAPCDDDRVEPHGLSTDQDDQHAIDWPAASCHSLADGVELIEYHPDVDFSAGFIVEDSSAIDEEIEFSVEVADEEAASPAPISIGAGAPRNAADGADAQIAAAEDLIDEYEELDATVLDPEEEFELPPLDVQPAKQNSRAENPFDEEFAEEEIIVSQFRSFDGSVFQAAPRVFDQSASRFQLFVADAGVSSEAAEDDESQLPCETRSADCDNADACDLLSFTPREVASDVAGNADTPRQSSIRASQGSAGEVLVVDDDRDAQPEVVPASQFRRLFSTLESASQSRSG